MAGGYSAADSPRDSFSDEHYAKLVQETSKGIAGFNQLTRSIAQKMSLFGTPQDSRANHKQLNELVDKGNKIVTKIQRRLKDLAQACAGPQARSRKTQVNKLSTDFKNQLRSFEETCKRLVESEKNAVELIRRSSTSFRSSNDMNKPINNNNNSNNGMNFTNYDEDQIYAQANIVMYDEDDLARREEDIIHINHQLREVNAAFKEIDGLIEDQGEVIVEIVDNTQDARDNVDKALKEVRQADKKAKYCYCGRTKFMCYGGFALIIGILIISLVLSAK